MLVVLSPAKTLDFSPPSPDVPATDPMLVRDTAALARVTRRLKAADLTRLMGISDALADLNAERFRAFQPDPEKAQGVQAALAFAGDVYEGLKARTLDGDGLAWAQEHVRILSGLYGLLRPLDRIQPHRLEMGTRLPTPRGASLYDFWGDRIARRLDDTLKTHSDPTLVNLASIEYFGAVDRKALKRPVVSCAFRQIRDGELRNLSLFAKTGRGLMARYAIDHRITRAEDLKGFDRAGYGFRPDLSGESEWVFTRPQPATGTPMAVSEA